MKASAHLNSLLEQSGEYLPLYGGGLSTHLPMVLVALERLRAPSHILQSTFTNDVKGLELIGSLQSVKPVNFVNQYLGNSDKFREYLKYFKSELEIHDIQAVLKKSLPLLIKGVAASAFHALIRLAYAVEAKCESEVAVALAYWSAEYQAFDLNVEMTSESVESTLSSLAPLAEDFEFSPGIIVNRMSEIAELLKRNQVIIQPESISLSSLRNFALNALYGHDDFTLLHTVTGCHAFSIVMPYLNNKESALRELWKAIVVAYLSTGLSYENQSTSLPDEQCDFTLIINDAIHSGDSHVIKLVYSCLSEYQKHSNPLYFIVAKRAVKINKESHRSKQMENGYEI